MGENGLHYGPNWFVADELTFRLNTIHGFLVLMTKVALITGITGQDGAYLAKLLLSKGVQVYGTVRDRVRPNSRNLAFLGVDNLVELVPANLQDLSNVIRLVERVQPNEIYNLASQSSVGLSFEQPIGTVELNVLSTMNSINSDQSAIRVKIESRDLTGKFLRMPNIITI